MPLRSRLLALIALLLCLATASVRAEAMLQYFNTDYRELTFKIPELAEVGYTSIWLPPPCKGSGGLSVGYDLWDRFDLGSKDQRGTLRTLYGTEGELLELIETAHRFGIRIYFDNITNHNAFDIPGYNETTPIDLYPGFVPEDFHLRRTQDGFYRKWDNTRDWNDTWQVQNLGLSDLIDIAHESPNTNHGFNEGDDMQKMVFVRHPNNPEYYLDTDLPQIQTGGGVTVTVFPFANKEPFQDIGYSDGGNTIGAGNGKFDFKDLNSNGQHDVGESSEPFTDTGVDPGTPTRKTAGWGFGNGRYDMGNPVAEDVNAMLIRSGRWLMDRTKCDGYRLDAVKHVPDYFYGQIGGANKDRSNAGFMGASQEQFNLARGFLDWDNHRDTVFDTEKARDDAMMFGEHLGEPPGFGGYFESGMRLVDNPLRNQLNDKLGNPSNGLNGFDQPGAGGFAPELGVTHAQSHDSDYAARRELQHAYYFTRAGLPLIYTDGNNKAGLLEGSGGAFPRHANTAFLGQWGDGRIPNVVYLHNHFARGYQVARFSDADFVAYERLDKRENPNMTDADAATLVFMMNDNFASGQGRSFATSFNPGAYLYNYSSYGGGFYKFADKLHEAVVPPGGYFAFSWRSPEQPSVAGSATAPITIRQSGTTVGTIAVERKDGRNGDPGFNPYGLPDSVGNDYKYTIQIPRVTNGADLSFTARADASAENILMTLDGGVDINSHIPLGPTSGDLRDNPPALSTDTFIGYEQMEFVRRAIEKFAAADSARNVIGSNGAETWRFTVGAAGITSNLGNGLNSGTNTASFVYHDPLTTRDIGGAQFSPAPQGASGQAITVKVKTGLQFQIDQVRLYYTTDGSAPEGSGGSRQGTTQVVTMTFEAAGPEGNTDWWTGAIPAQPAGTIVRYKIGVWKNSAGSIFPGGPAEVALKTKAETVFRILNFNATTAKVRPHNDYGEERVGLAEGFHVLRARAFLNRGGRASIYNTWTQTFYYDTQTPQGEIKFPAQNDTLGGASYGAVVRTSRDVTEVWYQIADGDATNDDGATGSQNGNGSGPEPYSDTDGDGTRDANESFVDINGNGVFDAIVGAAWQRANEVTPSPAISSAHPKEWRFTYRNIPASGTAVIKVRLFEVSSTRNLTLAPAAAHVTELTRTVNTAGPNLRLFVGFPQQDGQTIGEGYVMKARFTNTLGDGLSEADLRARFSVKIASQRSGEADGAVTQPAQQLPIIYNSAAGYHDFAFALPDLYNGNPDFLHFIEVTMARPGNSPLVATRLVRAQPVVAGPFVSIINPPEFDSDGKRHEIILPDVPAPTAQQRQFTIEVDTDAAAQNVAIVFTGGTETAALINDGTPNPRIEGDHKFWRFQWSSMTAGEFTFEAQVDTDGSPASVEARDIRNVSVLLRQIVPDNPADTDDDDDGLSDAGESTITSLPGGDPNNWTNAQVHVSFAYGVTNPHIVDSDGDGLPDGLEVGWETASDPGTSTGTDTNGDGILNFIGDLDAPKFNVTGNANRPGGYDLYEPWSYDFNRARTDLIAGTVTNPNRADTDDDGRNDGLEDANRNGRVEVGVINASGDVTAIHAHPPTVRGTSRIDRAKLPAGSALLETDPNTSDSDGDALRDGSEDADGNGRVSLLLVDLNVTEANGNFAVLGPLDESGALGLANYSNITFSFGAYQSARPSKTKLAAQFPKTHPTSGHQVGVIWTETDPCDGDTDADGLPDGWEQQNGLDPLDAGVGTSLRTGKPALAANGADGDPDADGLSNLQELINGTDPRQADTGAPPPPNSIVIGPQTPLVVGGVSNAREFTDWTADDLIVLDEQDGDGTNNGGSDVYHANDGFDASRDLVAFYAHDGGDVAAGGDGNFYFRVDLADLKAFAEDGRLDIYVVINVGNAGLGERNLPDQVDTFTTMGWQAVVACYSGNNGRVHVDTNPTANSSGLGQPLTGVVARDQTTPDGFKKAYFRSDLDAVEFSISRKALRDAGWNGLNAADLIYQVFTTKDGTQNSPVGPGDIGGRGDIRDTIYDDHIASDYHGDQDSLRGSGSRLQGYFGRNAGNDRGRSAKIISLVHGNQHIQPGNVVQELINTAQGAGYYRALDVHQAFAIPLSLHITPTLASSIQWASVDQASPRLYRDGPAFNDRLRALANAGTVQLLGSTFSDHIIDYFPSAFNAGNVALAREYLGHFYGTANVSQEVFWNPERVADGDVFPKISGLGFGYSFIDQQRHIFKWFGRETSLSDAGYRLNEINGVKCFVINDNLSGILFQSDDGGASSALRRLLLRKARSSTQDQVIVAFANWESFADKSDADSYDATMRWLASRPWVQVVTPQQIANEEIDLNVPPDGAGNAWGAVNRGTALPLAKVQHDFLDHATQENYDNWYNGQLNREEGLRNKRFEVRPGTMLSAARKFGEVGVDGVSNEAWGLINPLAGNSPLGRLARGTAFASVFQTGFHNQSNNDRSKFSTGAYIFPDNSNESLAPFAKASQAQFRNAAIYQRVAAWSAQAIAGAYAGGPQREQSDVDLDGEDEYLLFNDRIFAVFERLGGRMTGAWVRDLDTQAIHQCVGNFLSYAGFETEHEGANNTIGSVVDAHRVSAFRDQYFQTSPTTGTSGYVNLLYNVTPAPSGVGWNLSPPDGKFSKQATMEAARPDQVTVWYGMSNGQLFVRSGLSPHLQDLLLNGQKNLALPPAQAVFVGENGGFHTVNRAPGEAVRVSLLTRTTNTMLNTAATDRDAGATFDTIKLRNLAQTQQAEFITFSAAGLALRLEAGTAITIDSDGDNLPDGWELSHGMDITTNFGLNGGTGDRDGDGMTNLQELVFGGDPNDPADGFLTRVTVSQTSASTRTISFPSRAGRAYHIEYTNALNLPWNPAQWINGTGAEIVWTDDGTRTGTPPDQETKRFYRVRGVFIP